MTWIQVPSPSSSSARLLIVTAMQITVSSELNTWNTWFAGKRNAVWFQYSLGACTHGDLLAEQGGLTEQISTATSRTTW